MDNFRSRLFLGIDVSYKLKDLMSMISSTIESGFKEIKWITGTHLHITLAFLGNVEKSRVPELIQKIKDTSLVEPFEMKVEGTGVFPNESFPRVFWLDISQGRHELEGIHNRLEQATMPYKENQRTERFIPHITIGRLQTKANHQKLNITNFLNALYEPIRIDVNSVQLYESNLRPEGPIYTVLEKFSLK